MHTNLHLHMPMYSLYALCFFFLNFLCFLYFYFIFCFPILKTTNINAVAVNSKFFRNSLSRFYFSFFFSLFLLLVVAVVIVYSLYNVDIILLFILNIIFHSHSFHFFLHSFFHSLTHVPQMKRKIPVLKQYKYVCLKFFLFFYSQSSLNVLHAKVLMLCLNNPKPL